jgi:hypothetical protein
VNPFKTELDTHQICGELAGSSAIELTYEIEVLASDVVAVVLVLDSVRVQRMHCCHQWREFAVKDGRAGATNGPKLRCDGLVDGIVDGSLRFLRLGPCSMDSCKDLRIRVSTFRMVLNDGERQC